MAVVGKRENQVYTFAIAQNWAKSATRRLRSSTKTKHKYQQEKDQFPNKTAYVVRVNGNSAWALHHLTYNRFRITLITYLLLCQLEIKLLNGQQIKRQLGFPKLRNNQADLKCNHLCKKNISKLEPPLAQKWE